MDQRWSSKSKETGSTLSINKTFICLKADNTNINYVTREASQQTSFCQQDSSFIILGLHCNGPTSESLSSEWTLSHKSFIEIEFSHNDEAQNTWFECQIFAMNPTLVRTP